MAAPEIRRRSIAIKRCYGWLWRTKLEHCRPQCYISNIVDNRAVAKAASRRRRIGSSTTPAK
ncbi:hypothetical protein [Bradyrhizobium sp. Ce-3]|uniref:hypothetical protein n=1 Tax=Bradyrhizobium sp. Ce-3 TaxID=2913970 RepID=UPI001FB8C593|nr:hypothetical protein [Bradyrhizobium sp. Ce-3]